VTKNLEETIQIARAYETGKPDSLVVVIPAEVKAKLRVSKGTKFYVKIDILGRIIYEPVIQAMAAPRKGKSND
jgi:antitoxin component of MazEF toxin-antitoxin module